MKLCRFLAFSFCSVAALGAAHAEDRGRNPNLALFFATQADSPSLIVSAASAPARLAKDKLVVRASWYGGGERLNQRTSTGEIFRPMGRTAAHRTLPLGTVLRVSSLETGHSTIVRVNDRGPAASTGRALDLSRGAAMELGITAKGSAQVAIEVMR